ncbi:ThuA domain-containing protein [Lysobacter sp. M15]|uniref:ThuA domain-containing protein n=1 Tax=Lysobacter sp. M15 TaxID=2916837 RepID=UPI001F58492E|nr:ThuA domain-containing protein [Lysobacter sp. M15]
MRIPTILACCAALLLAGGCTASSVQSTPEASAPASPTRILVFTRTAGFRHDSIPVGVDTLRALAAESGLQVEHSEDPNLFDAASLSRFRAVVFLNATGDVLDGAQQLAFERYIAAGGGYLGVHAAADTEYDWPWYGDLVGAWFQGHPPGLQTTDVRFEGDQAGLAADWRISDELYNYKRNPRSDVEVLATVDEDDYTGGTMGNDHPIAWCHASGGGRAWYTGLGHDAKMYADPTYRAHLLRGLHYVTGQSADC